MKALLAGRGKYIVGGLLIGAFWYFNRARAPWEEALRTIAVFAIILFAMRRRLRRRSIDMHLAPLLAGKAALVIVAAAADTALVGSVARPAVITAVGLGVAIALLGSLFDERLFTRLQTSQSG